MRRSPRRPLILKRRKLPFHQSEAAEAQNRPAEPESTCPSSQSVPDGVRVMDHPSMSGTQVVVIPKTANLQSVISALTVKGKESGVQGPNKFILLSANNEPSAQAAAQGVHLPSRPADGLLVVKKEDTPDAKSLPGSRPLIKDLPCGPLDDSLTNIQWLGKMNSSVLETDLAQSKSDKESQKADSNQAEKPAVGSEGGRPPFSYMAMIQFAINSRQNKMMTLKEIYTWIENHFPYYRDLAKPGWKNSIRHNLSLHDMFIRETSPDGKVSFWTIRPEANRCLTLDQVYKPGCDAMTSPVPVSMLVCPHQPQKRILPDVRKPPVGSERRIKPLLPRTESYLVPIQLPVPASIFLPSASPAFHAPCPQKKRSSPREAKRVRIAPKVIQSDARDVSMSPQSSVKVEVKEESVDVRVSCETPRAAPKTNPSRSRRKQRLVQSLHEEPVLLCPNNTFFDSGVASDASSMLQNVRDADADENWSPKSRQRPDRSRQRPDSPDREYCFKTPIKSSSHLASSTPSKPSGGAVAEPWKVTPVGKGTQTVLDFSPIRTPGSASLTPRCDFTALSFSGTPFKDCPLFNSPRELLTSAPPRATAGGAPEPPGASPGNRSITEGFVLDTMNDSLSKILVDISFTGLEDDDLGMANISWSEFFPQLK
ncbi:forkhead box protein M1 [Salarias fasciatus]|uniref:forkhead box protein M1 n=1 Tax=Salarias fasciatus TaxID=181472 RepID=UPI001176C1BD|nr:forkhead box protein M1 [Salarias fasciatus]